MMQAGSQSTNSVPEISPGSTDNDAGSELKVFTSDKAQLWRMQLNSLNKCRAGEWSYTVVIRLISGLKSLSSLYV